MRRILGDTANRGSAPASSPWRGRGGAPGTPRQGHLPRPPCFSSDPSSPRDTSFQTACGCPFRPRARLRWPQTPGLQPHRRRRRREEPTHFGALSSPLSTSISPAAAAGSQAPLPVTSCFPPGTRVPGHQAPPPPAETGRSGRRINSLVHSLCGLGKTPGRVELSAA